MTFDEWVIGRLRLHGAYGGAMDGVPGREMYRGLQRFQEAEGLAVAGLADEVTVNALRREPRAANSVLTKYGVAPVVPAEPVWMREARRLIGVREQVGKGRNSVIMSWARRLGGWVASFYADDNIAWCGLFIAHIISFTLPREPLPANPSAHLTTTSSAVSSKSLRSAQS